MKKTSMLLRGLLLSFLLLTGCKTVDPLEPLNRKIFCFNMALDRALFRPIARAYDKVMPPTLACGIGNFFDNIDDITNIPNEILQFKFYDAWSDVWRVGFNSTIGLFGLIDVATCAGLPKHHQDFGLTLARYGFVCSTYLMVPFFGPSTIRDSIGWFVDWNYLSVWPYIEPKSLRYGLYGLRLVHKRALLLPADQLIDDAIDPYLFVRDAYLQKRECEIKAICPPDCSDATADAAPPAGGKPATAAGATKDSDDTFVADDSDDTKASSNKNGQTATTATVGPKPTTKHASDDPFVDP